MFGTPFRHPGDTLGHFLDTLEPGARRAPKTLRGTIAETPRFSGTLLGTPPETLRARRARKTPVAGRGGVARRGLLKPRILVKESVALVKREAGTLFS